jgi:hypothetical protein
MTEISKNVQEIHVKIVIDNLDEIKKQIEELGKAIDAPKFVVEKAE